MAGLGLDWIGLAYSFHLRTHVGDSFKYRQLFYILISVTCVQAHLLHLVDTTLTDLEDAGCIELGGEGRAGGGQTQSRGEEVRRTMVVVVVVVLLRFRRWKCTRKYFPNPAAQVDR